VDSEDLQGPLRQMIDKVIRLEDGSQVEYLQEGPQEAVQAEVLAVASRARQANRAMTQKTYVACWGT
jgi:hypothetical protein